MIHLLIFEFRNNNNNKINYINFLLKKIIKGVVSLNKNI
jgi:hypothetical protein